MIQFTIFQYYIRHSQPFSTAAYLRSEAAAKQYTIITEEDGIKTVCLNDPKKRYDLTHSLKATDSPPYHNNSKYLGPIVQN